MSTEDMKQKILDFVKVAPRTPTEVANQFKLTREHCSTFYLYPLRDESLIVKIDGTNKYQLKGQSVTAHQVDRMLADESKFSECETIKNWRKYNTAKDREDMITRIERICLGKSIKGFKINPDAWTHPTDTENFIQAWRKQSKKDKIPRNLRMALRGFLQNGLKLQLIESEARGIGIDGDKGKPQQSTLNMVEERYIQTKQILKKEYPTSYIKFGFSYGTFIRPSTRYIVKCEDLHFYDRTIEFIEIDGEKITDKKLISYMKQKGLASDIKKYTHRACRLVVFENKTQQPYNKFIYDQEVVTDLEKFVQSRIHQGLKYLFWNKNETQFDFLNYDRIVFEEVKKDNEVFKKVFFEVGFKNGDFGTTDRANYAIRHFGVQKWLQQSNYNYGLIAEMGWEDINTLRLWYGKRPASEFEKSVDEVLF